MADENNTTPATETTTPAAPATDTLTSAEQSFMDQHYAKDQTPADVDQEGDVSDSRGVPETPAKPAQPDRYEQLVQSLPQLIAQAMSAQQEQAKPKAHPFALNLNAEIGKLATVLGEDARGPLVDFQNRLTESLSQALGEQGEASRKAVEQAQAWIGRMQFNDAVRTLKTQFPQLAQEGVMEQIEKRTAALVKSGGYEDIHSAVSDACRLEFFDTIMKDRQTQIARTHRDRSRGQPMTPGRQPVSTQGKQAKPGDIEDAYINTWFNSGGNKDEAAKAARAARSGD